jgi:hypothetical protein
VGVSAGVADLDPLWTSLELRSRGRDDIFLSHLTTSGGFRGSTQLGGGWPDSSARVIVQPDGSFYVSGEFEGNADYDRLGEGGVLESHGLRDIFVAHFGPGTGFRWAFAIGGEQAETLGGITQDTFGNIYVLGSFAGMIDVEPGDAATLLPSSGAADIFVAKYSEQGQLRRVQGMSNPQHDVARAIAMSRNSNVLIGGEFRGTIDLGSGLSVSTGRPEEFTDVFVARYARDVWTPLPLRAYLPDVQRETVAD